MAEKTDKKAQQVKLTKFELEIMEALWQVGSGSVRELQEQLNEERRPAYTTVQTIINRLEEKGAVRRVKKIGNAFIYEPAITRKAAFRRLIDDLLDLFGGSVRPLMAHLIEAKKVSLEDVREMENALETLAEEEQQQPSSKTKRKAGK